MRARTISAAVDDHHRQISLVFVALLFSASAVCAQTTAFTYQGQLTDAGALANGSYDVRFALFDSAMGGLQIGTDKTVPAVPVSGGVFTVQLDFGVEAFPGANRFVEIGVKPAGVGSFTTLAPRQQISSSPYAIRTLSAATADALSSACVGCVQDTQINSVAGSKVSGTIPAASVPTGSGNYVQNTMAQQAGANFNVSGNGTAGSMNVNGAFSLAGISPPASAPAGQGRIYFDTASKKVKVSENGAAFVNLVGASGVSGSGTTSTIPLWSAGTTLGNSVITQSAAGVQLPNNVQLAAGAQGNQVQFGSPNSETGMTISGASGRADLRFDGTLKLLNGPGGIPPATNGIAITNTGNVGIGTTTPTNGQLHVVGAPGVPAIYGESANRGVWGRSTGASRGVYGDSVSGEGVHGESTSGAGVAGVSHGPDSAAVGGSNDTGGTGVFGQSFGGFNTGFAMVADGHTKQTRDKGGWVKAMAYVNSDGSIQRCYNSQVIPHATGDCGISVTGLGGAGGGYVVDFGFNVSDRFVSATAVQTDITVYPSAYLVSGSTNSWLVSIQNYYDASSAGTVASDFMIIVF